MIKESWNVERNVQGNNLDERNAHKVSSKMFRFMSKRMLASFMSIYGTVRMIIEQYKRMSEYMEDFQGWRIMPGSATIGQHIMPYLLSNNFVSEIIHKVPVTKDVDRTDSYDQKKKAVVVLPSSFALMDVYTSHIIDDISCHPNDSRFIDHSGIHHTACIERSRIIVYPREVFERSFSFWADDGSYPAEAIL